MKILYCGDGPVDGAARYLLGCIKSAGFSTTHLPPARRLAPSALKRRYDLIILSDMPAAQVPAAAQREIVKQVESGTGLLMVGGWASFSGPFGGWKGTPVEALLPVRCLGRDDRTNFPAGALVLPAREHEITAGLSFDAAPAVCGLNRVLLKPSSRVLVNAVPVVQRPLPTGARLLLLSSDPLPLLVVDASADRRVAAFTSDFAPHWSGGLVDWGPRTTRIVVKGPVSIEVGTSYVAFVKSLLGWLGRAA